MSQPLKHRLNESLRDAMLAYYLNHKVPAGQKGHLTNADHLYEYWLMDVQVSQAVPTSHVACAISSLQQYIMRIQLGLEPGYEMQRMTPPQAQTWREQLHAYPVWSASQQLRYHPASYLDPTLRRNKTDSFQLLENDLSQYRLQTDTLLIAVQNYLARFEEIANIRTLNGYIDGNAGQLHSSTYYFVGKSTSENTYYWRSLDLSQRSTVTPTKPSIHAWSDWKKINLTLSDNAVEQTIRPVFFNNRLFFIWAECIKPAPTSSFNTPQAKGDKKQRLTEWVNSHYVKLRLNFSYKKYDDSWSVPRTCINQHCATEEVNAATANVLKAATHTVAIVAGGTLDTLFLGLHVAIGEDRQQPEHFTAKFFQAVEIDQHFNVSTVADGGSPERYKILPGSELSDEIKQLMEAFDLPQRERVRGILRGDVPHESGYYSERLPDNARKHFTFFSQVNQGNLQFKVAPYTQRNIEVTRLETPTQGKQFYDYDDKQKSIGDITETSPTYDPNTNKLIITSTLDEQFRQPYTVTLTKQDGDASITITLQTHSALDDPDVTQLELSSSSQISGAESPFNSACYTFYVKNPVTHEEFTNAVHDKDQRLITATEGDKSGTISLEGKFIDKAAFIHLYTNNHIEFTLQLVRYSTYVVPTGTQRGVVKLRSQNVLIITLAKVTTSTLYLYKHVIMNSTFAHYLLSTVLDANAYRILNFQDTAHESLSGSKPELPKGHSVTAHIPLRDTAATDVTVVHGVITLEPAKNGTKILGYALKAVTLSVDTETAGAQLAQQRAPAISRHAAQPWGNAEFIEFSNSELIKTPPQAIRLNTCFASKLVQAASVSLDHFYSLSPKQWLEPPLTADGAAETIDFHGANGKYFWELFLYLPWLVAHRLNQEQQYDAAQTWLTHLFDPARNADNAGQRPAYWGFSELASQIRSVSDTSIDPHRLALDTPVHLRKALCLLHLAIVINRGDAAYRQQSPDSLTQAKLWYAQAGQLLRARPSIATVEPWASITLERLAKTASKALRQLEWQTPLIDANRPLQGPYLPLLVDTDNLCLPFNPHLVTLWDTLESRLHNLRHNLDITGKPLRPALYATPLSPQKLLASHGKSGFSPAVSEPFDDMRVGHYRFQAMLSHAQTATEAVIQFGTTLLTLIERKDQSDYLELQHQHAWELANIVVAQHTQALLISEKNHQALNLSRQIIEARLSYYAHQLTEGVSRNEAEAGLLYLLSAGFDATGSVAGAGAGIAMLAPNIVGTSVGGSRWEGPFHAVQALVQGAASALRSAASDLDRTEQFNRRAQEWAHAQELARLELAQIDAQLQAYAEQEKATQLQLRLAQTSLAQAWSSYQLLTQRFTKAQLYDWLNAQLSQVYYQAYDLGLALCQAAEASWRYEMADYSRTFIQPGAWNTSYRGYLAGETLKLSLLNMNNAYLQNNVRDLEIVKTLSLRHRLLDCQVEPITAPDEATQIAAQEHWTGLKKQLVSTGALCFKLTKALFDEDYPGHILRRIKSISVSLPATLGPYEDIKAILTQTGNEIEQPNGQSLKDKRAHQHIALSTGVDDNGLFTLTFDSNDRYLPFEYTGVISEWSLTFPNPSMQKGLLESINDIIIHLRYTARVKPSLGAPA